MDYKRLTKRNNDGTVGIDKGQFNDKINKNEEQEQKSENATEWASNFIKRLARAGENAMVCCERLAELEDKIEQGTLIELPCKVGDVLYYVNKYEPTPRIEENKVHTIEIYECRDGLTIRIWTQNGTFYADKMPNVFKTKSEAEAKLKELQGAER